MSDKLRLCRFHTTLARIVVIVVLVGAGMAVADGYRDLNRNGRMEPYENPNLAVDKRVYDLLPRMTLQEKIGQMIHSPFALREDGMPSEHILTMARDIPPENLKKGIQEQMVGSLYGPGSQAYPDAGAAARCTNRLQQWAENSRLGIPLIVSMDSVHGLSYVRGAAIWPHALGLAATRNVGLVKKLAGVLARESRAVGFQQTLGPVADVGTDPRWGRVMETCGEDAELAAEMVRAQVLSLQGEALNKDSVLCTVKHFPGAGPEKDGVDAANFFSAESLFRRSTIISTEDTLEYHLKPFKAAIEAGTGAIMPYYSSVKSLDKKVPALGSHKVLTDLLRNGLGYDGIICSDAGPVELLTNVYGYSRDKAIQMVVSAGTDSILFASPSMTGDIARLVRDGKISEETIDDSVRRILRVKFQLGLFEAPYVDPEYAEEIVGCEEHQKLSLQAARDSMTLLKNNGILPLSKDAKILVAGPRSDDMRSLGGGWTGYPQPGVTLLQAIKNKASDETEVLHELTDAQKAKELAWGADVAVVAVGEPQYIHTSPWGPEQLSLADEQLDLIKAIHETGTPTIVVLLMGRPYIIPWCAENVSGIIAAYYPGTRGGEAIADVLFGDHNPNGKLPFQMPRSMKQVKDQREDKPFDIEDPLYPYGHGMSRH